LTLPIDAQLPHITRALREHPSLVLVASPGAGKTTRLPPALVREAWFSGKVLMLEPRRIAARAAAARIAAEQGWTLGAEVGYHVRFERKARADSLIEVVTEGILTRRLQDDPFLEGVAAVILDEFHERSVHSDLALALLREVQLSARQDLRLCVMSATLDAEKVAKYLDCPTVNVEGQVFPLDIHYAESFDKRPLEVRVAAAIRRAANASSGDVLTFLPGMAEIRRVAQALAEHRAFDVVTLHGSLTLDEQRRVLQKGEKQRVVLATNIAETSLTVPGVRCVVDSGLVRRARYDLGLGLDVLDTVRVSAAAAEQRAGRAAREGPGIVYRLWPAEEQTQLLPFTTPEILRVDIAPQLLEICAWGLRIEQMTWFEAPTSQSVVRAEQTLKLLGALDAKGAITALGRRMVRLPLPPRLSKLLISAADQGYAHDGATLAALLAEQLPSDVRNEQGSTSDSDVEECYERFTEAEYAGFRAHQLKLPAEKARQVARTRDQLLKLVDAETVAGTDEQTRMRLLLEAYPDRVVRRRAPRSQEGVMVGGRGVVIDRMSVVREAEFLLAIHLEDRDNVTYARVCSAIDPMWLKHTERRFTEYDVTREAAIGRRQFLYEDLVLKEQHIAPDSETATVLLVQRAVTMLETWLQQDEHAQPWLLRLATLRQAMPELHFTDVSATTLRELLPHICLGKTTLAEVKAEQWIAWLESQLTYEEQRKLVKYAPTHLSLPNGRALRLTYQSDGPPILAAKLQWLFGIWDTPTIANGRIKLRVHVLAPNGRPVQMTQDLRNFWTTTYAEVRKELRARYPKHDWPVDPLADFTQR